MVTGALLGTALLALGAAPGAGAAPAAASAAAVVQTGHVWAWGGNSYGQLGDGTNIQRNAPVQVPGLDGVRSVDGGSGHSVAKRRTDYPNPSLDSVTEAYAWGLNHDGQLGDGTTTNRSTSKPTLDYWFQSAVAGTDVDVDAVAAGDFHNVYVDVWGRTITWGKDASGQLGHGTNEVGVGAPFPITLNNGGVKAVAAGGSHSLALRLDGAVLAWGDNSQGQLGNGTTTGSNVPVRVGTVRPLNLFANAKAIAAGGQHSLALKNDGTVWAWGYNGDGELGDGTTTNRVGPVQVGGLTGVVAIAAGDRHSLAVKSDGTVWAWGFNGMGQLGDGSTTNRLAPVQVLGLTGVTMVAGGGFHSLALKNDGTVRAWGYNFFGQLGNGGTANSATPFQVSGLSGVISIGAGTLHSLAVKP